MRNLEQKIVIGIVEKMGKILMVKRYLNGKLFWFFPGGKIEDYDRDERAAIKREIYEETNVDCTAIKNFGSRVHPDTEKILSYWLCEYNSGNIQVKNKTEIEDVKWNFPSEVLDIISTDLYEPIKDYLGKLM